MLQQQNLSAYLQTAMTIQVTNPEVAKICFVTANGLQVPDVLTPVKILITKLCVISCRSFTPISKLKTISVSSDYCAS